MLTHLILHYRIKYMFPDRPGWGLICSRWQYIGIHYNSKERLSDQRMWKAKRRKEKNKVENENERRQS